MNFWATIFYMFLVIAGIAGWVLNIIQIFNANFSAVDGELVLRVIGIFVAPLGAVLGYL